MVVQQTSLEAYYNVRLDLGNKQAAVYRAIKQLKVASDKEISVFLRWDINRVTPRRGELIKKGLVRRCGVALNNYDRSVWLYEVAK